MDYHRKVSYTEDNKNLQDALENKLPFKCQHMHQKEKIKKP